MAVARDEPHGSVPNGSQHTETIPLRLVDSIRRGEHLIRSPEQHGRELPRMRVGTPLVQANAGERTIIVYANIERPPLYRNGTAQCSRSRSPAVRSGGACATSAGQSA